MRSRSYSYVFDTIELGAAKLLLQYTNFEHRVLGLSVTILQRPP